MHINKLTWPSVGARFIAPIADSSAKYTQIIV